MERELVEDLRPAHVELQGLVEHVGGYRGKQLRAAMVFLSGQAVGEISQDHVQVAKVVELVHTATLVHDDVLDGAMLRRRIPTVNALHGNEIPVLLGDYIYSRAFQMALGLDDPTCSKMLSLTTGIMCQGEITQILHRFDFDWNEERYYRVIGDKTASLYATACRLGGHYAGGAQDDLEALEAFGHQVGVAFQIIDDCLDLEGEESVVGKSLGTDLTKGKLTLPLLFLVRDGEGVAEHLKSIMAEPDEERALVRLRREFDLRKALDYSLEKAADRIARAQQALAPLPSSPALDALGGLAEFVLRRDR
jgi:octaprenyl-diphosphate synthase